VTEPGDGPGEPGPGEPGPGNGGPEEGGPGGGGCPFPGPISRRRLLGGLGLAGAGMAIGGAAAAALGPLAAPTAGAAVTTGSNPNRTFPFYGDHQAGIVTPAQDRLAFAAMNVLPGTSRATCARCCGTGPSRPSG
jgi:deferrochelatase/peroxidase EfeB